MILVQCYYYHCIFDWFFSDKGCCKLYGVKKIIVLFPTNTSLSQWSHTVFCINLYFVAMIVLVCFKYSASDKRTFIFCNDNFGFMLLKCLVINLKSVMKAWNPPKVVWYNQKLLTIFNSTLPNSLSIAGPIFSTTFWTLADYVPLLRCMIHSKILCSYTR